MLGYVTVSRILMFHMILSILIGIIMFLHIEVLHDMGSSDRLGSSNVYEDSSFLPFSIMLDLFYILFLLECVLISVGYDI
jgi:quinol-cytochrome oxidoreductase complex cytochrome b subunit